MERRSGPSGSAVVGERGPGQGSAPFIDEHAAAAIGRIVVDDAIGQGDIAIVTDPDGAADGAVVVHELAHVAGYVTTISDAQRAASQLGPVVFHAYVNERNMSGNDAHGATALAEVSAGDQLQATERHIYVLVHIEDAIERNCR